MNKKKYKILIISLLILLSTKAISQEKLNFAYVDSTTYNCYLQKDWQNLIKLSKQALKQNIDYYYLRMRIGIAYYERKQFIKAIPYFTKAIEFNNDTIAIEYLYYSYIFSGQYFKARLFAHKQDSLINKKLSKNDKPNSLFFDYQYAKNTNSQPITFEQDVYDQDIATNERYFDFGLTRLTTDRTYLTFSFARYTNITTHYHQDLFNENNNELFDVSQTFIYGGALIHLTKNFNLASYTNFIFGKKTNQNNLKTRNTPQPQPYQQQNERYLIPINYNYLQYNFNNFKAELGVCGTRIDSNLMYYPNLNITYYPLNNNRLEFNAGIEYLNNPRLSENFTKPVYSFGISVILFKKLTLFANYKLINSKNYIEQNGFVFFNGDLINNKFLIESTLSFKHFGLFARYQYINLTNTYFYNFITTTNNYNNQTILGGIKWNF
ncbi:MAG: hypothetical protein DRI94_12980 [Bacteroidetes bacterium]|nr:MAG: hypothetical protein DRI94_12980 [Bacteroidota bacterium]